MGKVKENLINKQEITEVRNLARHNKNNIMYKRINFQINGTDYETIIKGVGAKAIKLECYLDYERIFNNKDSGIIENLIWEKLNMVYHKEAPQTIGDRRII